jgi:hypothetical protein
MYLAALDKDPFTEYIGNAFVQSLSAIQYIKPWPGSIQPPVYESCKKASYNDTVF